MDIQEKPQLMKKNHSAQKKFIQAIAHLFPDPIFIIDRDGKCLEVLGGSEWSLYRSGKFITNKYLHDLLPAQLSGQFMQAISASIEENSLKIFDYQLSAEDIVDSPPDSLKGRFWFAAHIYPLRNAENETDSVIFLPVNITLRKNLQEQVTELSAKDQLTKAFNRRHFMQIFENEFAISKRYNNRLSILYLAIDRLQASAWGLPFSARRRARVSPVDIRTQFTFTPGFAFSKPSDNS